MAKALVELLNEKPVFVNLGVRGFAESLRSAGFEVVHVNWSPPAGGDLELAAILDGFNVASAKSRRYRTSAI